MIDIITWTMTVMSIFGTIANSFQKRFGFYFWLVANIFWVGYNFYNKMYAQAAVYLFNSIMCVVGLYKWKKNNSNTDHNNAEG